MTEHFVRPIIIYNYLLFMLQVRDSFMRQFVFELGDDENEGVKKVTEVFDSKVVYRKQRPIKLLNNLPKVRHVNTDLRKAAITYIIK